MTQLESELAQLKGAILDMMKLASEQLRKAQTSINDLDTELAQEVIYIENRMNALELSIDRDCENMFALFNPVATESLGSLSVTTKNKSTASFAMSWVVEPFKTFNGVLDQEKSPLKKEVSATLKRASCDNGWFFNCVWTWEK